MAAGNNTADNLKAKDIDAVYLAADGYTDDLQAELGHRGAVIIATVGRLVFASGVSGAAAWAQNTWLAPRALAVPSVKQAARSLRSVQRNWYLHSSACHRRAQLIADQLPSIRFRPQAFPFELPTAPLGAWTLFDHERMLVSEHCSSPFPDGEITFVEDREGPPNRAYLKLWEALTLIGNRPRPGQRCLDLGAAPGGWSWVLAQLGADVVSLDRADLAPDVAASPQIRHQRGNAFELSPESLDEPDWVVSDIVAYPQRILELARRWAEAWPQANLVFTVKFQHEPNPAILDDFLAIPDSGLVHLAHNKHELTWLRLPGGPLPAAARRQ